MKHYKLRIKIIWMLIAIGGIYLTLKRWQNFNFNLLGAAILGGLFVYLFLEGYNEIKKRKDRPIQ